jgi:hypothetical protein
MYDDKKEKKKYYVFIHCMLTLPGMGQPTKWLLSAWTTFIAPILTRVDRPLDI